MFYGSYPHTHKRKKHSLMLKVAKDEYSFQLIWIWLTGNRWVFISFHRSQTRTKMENIRNVSNSHMKHSFGIVQFHKVFNNFSSLDTNARNLIKMNEPFPPYTLFGGAKNRKLHSYAIELYVASAQRNKFYTFDYFSWRFFFFMIGL